VNRNDNSNPHPLAIPVAKAIIHNAAVSFIDNKKKFPDNVTNVRPIAIIPTRAASRIIVLRLNKVRKFGAVTIP
jgi:hypothetical protein